MKIPKRTNKKKLGSAFSLVEMVGTVALIAIVAAISLPIAYKSSQASRDTKLTNEVATINRAILVYKSSGGDLNGITDAQTVLEKLKTVRNAADAQRYVGYTGSAIDSRVDCVYGHADDDALCATWNPGKQQFELGHGGDNVITRFALTSDTQITEETRADSALQYAESGWVWDYDDRIESARVPAGRDLARVPERNPAGSGPSVVNATPVGNFTPTVSSQIPDGGYESEGIVVITPAAPPKFLILGGEYDRSQYPLACHLINPNGLNAKIYYKIKGKHEEWQPYGSSFYCDPYDSVVAYCESTNALYTNSSEVTETYTTNNKAPHCVDDAYTMNIIYNTHLFAGSNSYKRYGFDDNNVDRGTFFGENDNNSNRGQIFNPCDNDVDPDGDKLIVCAARQVANQLPIHPVINDEGTLTFIPTEDPGLLGYRQTDYFDFNQRRGVELDDTSVNNQYDEFWKDIASVYKFRRSDEGDGVGNRQDQDGNFLATDVIEYAVCDPQGAQDVGEIVCRVQGLTVLSPIAIDIDGSGAIELLDSPQTFDFDGDGSKETVKGWFASNDGILVDANMGDNVSGEHLFGDMGGRYKDGFAKLAKRDLNENGMIEGQELTGLKLWFDNGNAQIDAGELKTIESFNIDQISLDHNDYVSVATNREGKELHVEDIWFPVLK